MTTRQQHNENANAEIIGVVILIGIFAVTAGILSATTLSSPQPVKVPAASIEMTGEAPGHLRVSHLGGDILPLDHLILHGIIDGVPKYLDGSNPTDREGIKKILVREDDTSLNKGFLRTGFTSKDIKTLDGDALVMSWRGDSGESVIASWDPNGIYGPLGPPTLSGGEPGFPFATRTVPAAPNPTTRYDATTDAVYAKFLPSPTSIGPGGTVTFTDSSTGPITHWLWNFGDNTPTVTMTSSPTHVDHPYERSGTYSVSLTVWNPTSGASNTAIETVTVTEGSPRPTFDVSPTVGSKVLNVTCSDPTEFGQTIWQWTFTDGLTGIVNQTGKLTEKEGKSYVHTFSNPSLTVNNTCRIDLTVWSPYVSGPIIFEPQFVIVAPPLQANFTVTPNPGLSGRPIQFTDTSCGLIDTWSWDFGDDITSTEQNPSHVFSVGPDKSQTFRVTLTITGPDGTQMAIGTVTVHPRVIANFTADPLYGTVPLTVYFTDTSTGSPSDWLWNFGDETSLSTEQNPAHTYEKNGTFTVTLYANRATLPTDVSMMTREIFIRVGPAVTADFTAAPTTVAAGDPVQFTDTSVSADPFIAPVNKWTWDFGDGTNSTAQHPSHIYTVPGTYTVTLTAENDYRTDTMAKLGYITVLPPVEARFIADATVGAMPMTVQFTDQSTENPTTWSWDFNSDSVADSTLQNPTFTYTAPGTYTVSLTASNAYDTNTTTKIGYIRVYGPVMASFTATPLQGLIPLAVRFTDTSTGGPDTLSWDFGDGTNSTEQHPNHTYTVAGNYTVRLTAANPYFSNTSAKNITAWPLTINATAGAGGTISPAGTISVPVAGSQAFAITPITGYHIADVLVDGVNQYAISSYTFTNVTTNHTIAATFAINTYTITWSFTGKGTIKPETPQTRNYGASCSFVITATAPPAKNAKIISVTIDGTTPIDFVSGSQSYNATISSVTNNTPIVVIFST